MGSEQNINALVVPTEPRTSIGENGNYIHAAVMLPNISAGQAAQQTNTTVSYMDETDAVALLLKSAGQANSPENEKIAVEILKELCYLPPAIVQAGKFIAQSGSLKSFLGIHTKNQAQLLSQKPHSDNASTVDATWQMSFDRLSQPAAMLLQLCSFLHWDGISEEIFSRAAIHRFQQAIPSDPSREALKKPLEFLAQFLGPAAIMGLSIMGIPTEHQQLASLRLISHLDSLRYGNQQVVVDFGAQYGMFGINISEPGRVPQAKELEVVVLEKRKQILDHEQSGIDISQSRRVPQGKELEVVVLEKRKQVLDHGESGINISQSRRIAQGRRAQGCSVAEPKQVLGDDHPDTLLAMGNLASTYHSLGEFHKAEELEVVVLEKKKQVLGDDHPDTLQTMANLGWTYNHLGEFQKAETLGIVVLEKRKRLLGENHPDSLQAMQDLASTYRHLGKLSEAAELETLVHNYEEALEGSVTKNRDGSDQEAYEDSTK
ncbi:hypothetical protein B0H13DRAFT_2265797 [Mycena leptocephala]|nr:hypothetical protein B0H13DRAFT_2265797 [Mycena leptocephala]